MTGFSDHFAPVASQYAAARPGYPPALFAWLAAQCADHALAWDCATGSGQAAVALGAHFAGVIATDASAAQLAQANAHPRVAYRLAPAEQSGLDDGSVDLVTVAQALHWFDLPRFHAEVRRVLKPGGVVAAWSYGIARIEDAAVDALTRDFYHRALAPYWPPERHHVETGYRELAFPFPALPVPALRMAATWTLGELLGYARSWSATARLTAARGEAPWQSFASRLAEGWGDAERTLTITWPLTVLAGRLEARQDRETRIAT